ncbi:unnamed protein product [Amoebophrya sp. A120]|nr:unnamed protein product [Amoebophrya sp. A120]|eukprot:GSA120T00016771001.1
MEANFAAAVGSKLRLVQPRTTLHGEPDSGRHIVAGAEGFKKGATVFAETALASASFASSEQDSICDWGTIIAQKKHHLAEVEAVLCRNGDSENSESNRSSIRLMFRRSDGRCDSRQRSRESNREAQASARNGVSGERSERWASMQLENEIFSQVAAKKRGSPLSHFPFDRSRTDGDSRGCISCAFSRSRTQRESADAETRPLGEPEGGTHAGCYFDSEEVPASDEGLEFALFRPTVADFFACCVDDSIARRAAPEDDDQLPKPLNSNPAGRREQVVVADANDSDAQKEPLRYLELPTPARLRATVNGGSVVPEPKVSHPVGDGTSEAQLGRSLWSWEQADLDHPSELRRQIRARFSRNNFAIVDEDFSPVGAAVLPHVAMLNHSCDPNVVLRYFLMHMDEMDTGTMRVNLVEDDVSCPPHHGRRTKKPKILCVLVALRDIAPHEEICHSYVDIGQCVRERRQQLRSQFGFACNCNRCKRDLRGEKHLVMHFCAEGQGEGQVRGSSCAGVSTSSWPKNSFPHLQPHFHLPGQTYSQSSNPDHAKAKGTGRRNLRLAEKSRRTMWLMPGEKMRAAMKSSTQIIGSVDFVPDKILFCGPVVLDDLQYLAVREEDFVRAGKTPTTSLGCSTAAYPDADALLQAAARLGSKCDFLTLLEWAGNAEHPYWVFKERMCVLEADDADEADCGEGSSLLDLLDSIMEMCSAHLVEQGGTSNAAATSEGGALTSVKTSLPPALFRACLVSKACVSLLLDEYATRAPGWHFAKFVEGFLAQMELLQDLPPGEEDSIRGFYERLVRELFAAFTVNQCCLRPEILAHEGLQQVVQQELAELERSFLRRKVVVHGRQGAPTRDEKNLKYCQRGTEASSNSPDLLTNDLAGDLALQHSLFLVQQLERKYPAGHPVQRLARCRMLAIGEG